MSTLKTNTLTGVSVAGSIAVTGEGNSTTTNLQQGLCKAWVNYTGITTTAKRDSFNISTLTDISAGRTTCPFTNNMANANYSGYFYTNADSGTALLTLIIHMQEDLEILQQLVLNTMRMVQLM